MISFEEFQRQRNKKYYVTRGLDFLKDFKTFAGDKYFISALAKDFYARVKKKGTINIYEMGIGAGTLFVSFMLSLRRLDATFPERIVYHLCDISEELVRNAVKRGDAFGFNTDGIVYDGLPTFVKNADYILSNELYSDLPAKLLMNDDGEIKELYIDDRKHFFKKFADGDIRAYMKRMPNGYIIPVNEHAKKHLLTCKKGLRAGGWLDIFDYGFASPSSITELPQKMWNASIYREFGGQITTDLNFHYIAQGLNATIEPQKEFVERILGKHLIEDIDAMRYRECKVKTRIREEGDFYHMRVVI
ncbi:MAG: SAM-dependent methyltransferase [Candidatus Bilamarchaeaceae archaeon]